MFTTPLTSIKALDYSDLDLDTHNKDIDKYLNKYPSFIKEYIGHHNHYEHKVDIINNLASKMSLK